MFRKVQHQPDGDRSQGGGSLQLDRGGQQALSVAPEDSGDKLTEKLIKLILKFQDNQIIYGKCGGYCGTCEPEHYKGLKLDVLPVTATDSLVRGL